MKGNLNIREVDGGGELRQFVDLPEHLYRGDPNWVPALRSSEFKLFRQKTAFFAQAEMALFLAWREGRPVGRIAAIHNKAHDNHYQDTVGFFGYFECADDAEAAKGLLARAEEWLKGRGLTRIRGPVNPSMNGECGLLIEGFGKPPMALMPYSPKRYIELLEGWGFAKCKDLFAYWVTQDDVAEGSETKNRLLRLSEALHRRNPSVKLRTLDMKRYEEEVLRFMAVFEMARKKNWGYVPSTDVQILETAKNLKMIIDPEIVIIAEVDGRPAGALLAIPNINIPLKAVNGRLFPFGFLKFFRQLKRVNETRVLGVAALQEDRAKGITALLMVEVLLRGIKRGYFSAEASWVLEDNQASNASIQGAVNAVKYKTYRIYEKAIGAN
jgi:hypothetical protein